MAERLDEFPRDGRRTKDDTDWEQLMDGNVWKLTKDVDFTCTIDQMRNRAGSAGRMRNGRTRTHKVDDSTLVIQFIPR